MSDPASIYIHVPFCRKKCRYCDFYSITGTRQISDYVDCLLKEIQTRSSPCRRIQTLYLGGGTPSVLPLEILSRIIAAVDDSFDICSAAEKTIEVNPGTVTPDYICGLKELGINRISIGVQSFNDEKLKFLGRIHSSQQAVEMVLAAQTAGFEQISLDLMYGLPHETMAVWQKDMATAMGLMPSHLSCYMLTVEPGTPLYRDMQAGLVCPEDQQTLSQFFKATSQNLTDNGYTHYEISSFSKGRSNRSLHNSNYWNMTPYLGFGPAAHSYDNGIRTSNCRDTNLYIKQIQSNKRAVAEKEVLTCEQQMLEMVMLGLRTCDGVDTAVFFKYFQTAFETKFASLVRQLQSESMAILETGCFFLTLKGMLHLDHIVEGFAEIIL